MASETTIDLIIRSLEDMAQTNREDHHEIMDRLSSLEKWRASLIAVGAAVGFLAEALLRTVKL